MKILFICIKAFSILTVLLFSLSAKTYAENSELNNNLTTTSNIPSISFYSAEEIKKLVLIGCIYNNVFYSSGSEINQNGMNKICSQNHASNLFSWSDKTRDYDNKNTYQ